MLLLAIDTSTPRVAVAIGENGRVRGEVGLASRRRHAEQLAPAIAYLREQTGVELGQLAAVAVGVGPGLFTGLRVGVTTAKIMAQALQIPVVAIPSLDLVAYPLRYSGRLLAVVLDARRHEVYSAQYRPVPGGVQRVSDYTVGPAGDLAAELEAHGDEVLVAGDGVDANRDVFAALDRVEYAGPQFETPSATALVELATGRVEREEFAPPWEIRPLYLRASDAELAWQGSR
jgi:tRNA threonylcarbamoyladenosine biosynthesis protein TsaB